MNIIHVADAYSSRHDKLLTDEERKMVDDWFEQNQHKIQRLTLAFYCPLNLSERLSKDIYTV